VPLYYFLADKSETPLTIEILDQNGAPVRTYSSEEGDFERCMKHNEDPRSPYEPEYPSADAGLNKWNWDTRRHNFTCVEDITLFAGLEGPRMPPGSYRAVVRAGGESAVTAFRLVPDPRLDPTPAQTAAWISRVDETAALLEDMLVSLDRLRQSKKQIQALAQRFPDQSELQASSQKAVEAIDAWDHQVIQPLHQTVEDEDAWETMLAGQVRFLLDVIDQSGAPATEGSLARLADLQAQWAALEIQRDSIRSDLIAPINDWANDQGVPHIMTE
jgi:hypothetical protein